MSIATVRLLAAGIAASLLAACATTAPVAASSAAPTPAASAAREAVAVLAPASASLVSGKLTLMPMGGGVHVTGEIGGLKPGGVHGFHLHETGDCSAVDASSAGGHFNPRNQAHGRAGHGAHHAGDADNLTADARGVARVDRHFAFVALGGGGTTDVVGRAVVVHAAADDYLSQPAGNAGARIACGVIRAVR